MTFLLVWPIWYSYFIFFNCSIKDSHWLRGFNFALKEGGPYISLKSQFNSVFTSDVSADGGAENGSAGDPESPVKRKTDPGACSNSGQVEEVDPSEKEQAVKVLEAAQDVDKKSEVASEDNMDVASDVKMDVDPVNKEEDPKQISIPELEVKAEVEDQPDLTKISSKDLEHRPSGDEPKLKKAQLKSEKNPKRKLFSIEDYDLSEDSEEVSDEPESDANNVYDDDILVNIKDEPMTAEEHVSYWTK